MYNNINVLTFIYFSYTAHVSAINLTFYIFVIWPGAGWNMSRTEEANGFQNIYAVIFRGRDSSVSIATRYGLGGPGIESRWGRDFPHPSIPALGPTQPPIQWVPGLFPGHKAAGAWRWPPTPQSSAEVKERVKLYFYSPLGLRGLF